MLKVNQNYNYFFKINFIIINENGIAIKLAVNPAIFSLMFNTSTKNVNPTVCIKKVGIPDKGNIIYFFIVGLILKLYLQFKIKETLIEIKYAKILAII